MIILGVGIGIFLAMALYYRFKEKDNLLCSLFGGFLSGLVGMIVATLFVIIAGLICMPHGEDCKCENKGSMCEYVRAAENETELIALKDNNLVSGRHGSYIYRGYIDEKLKYTYLYEIPNKGITVGKVSASSTYIKFIEDDSKPRLITKQYKVKNWFVDLITFDTMVNYTEYVLYIPEGSIVVEGEYNIDLE